jgi:hypothetical protein
LSRHGSDHFAASNSPVKIQQQSSGESGGALSGWIEAIGVDYTYQPPAERPIKPGTWSRIYA